MISHNPTHDNTVQFVLLNEVSVEQGFNPRKFFNKEQDSELLKSISENGIIQPISVRPDPTKPNHYLVIAGERRFRAAQHLQIEEIPVSIHNVDKPKAKLLALIENTIRSEMTVSDEAIAAREVLKGTNGNKEEAIKLLGWKKSLFDARILLTHAIPEVLDAVSNKTIPLGIAELLSQLPEEMQAKTLQKIIDNNYTIADVKTRLAEFAQDLSKACFDVSGCKGCPHNSELQATLFDTSIESGFCSNIECFSKKSNEFVLSKKEELKEKYSVVYLDTERLTGTFGVVSPTGDKSVGKAQFENGCAKCQFRGALMCTRPGKVGRVAESVCFSVDCLKKMIHANNVAKSASSESSYSMDNKQVPPANNTPKKEDVSPKTPPSPAVSITPKRTIEHFNQFFAETASKISLQDSKMALVVAVYFSWKALNFPLDVFPSDIEKKIPNNRSIIPNNRSLKDSILFLYDFSEQALSELQTHITGLLFQSASSNDYTNENWVNASKSYLKIQLVDFNKEFILTKAFLETYTKTGIEAILKEVVNHNQESFVSFYEAKFGEKSFAKLVKLKNSELIDKVMASGFDFTGYVPSDLIQTFNKGV